MACLLEALLTCFVLRVGATQLGGFQVVDPFSIKSDLRDMDSSAFLDEDPDDDSSSPLELLEMQTGAELGDLTHLEQLSMQELYSLDADTEKYGAGDFDCADEVVLRLAIAESFYGKSYDDCVTSTMEKTFAPGGSGEKLMAPKTGSGSGSGLTRQQVEDRVKARCITRQGHSIALGPRLIRMTFHDAADYNNSMLYDSSSVPVDKTGVDSCLRTALLSAGLKQSDDDDDLDEVMKGDPNHNRGLNNAIKWVLKMASASKLTQPDIQVLGAVVAMEAWLEGPEMGAQYGRKKGECQKIVCTSEKCWDKTTPFFKQPVAEPVGSGMFCPMTNTLEPLRKVVGLTLEELVALQGAHSVGGVIVCSGLGNVAAGPYCPTNCGIPPGNFFENGNLDGTSFDDTPGKLDNRYYQLLMDEEFEDLPACDLVKPTFPSLSKRGLKGAGNASVGGSGGSGKKDKAATCSAGVKYDPENACEVEACAENCSKSDVCLEAQNSDSADADSFKKAWTDCLDCKRMCVGSQAKRLSRMQFKTSDEKCKSSCNTTSECVESAGFDPDTCRNKCTADNTACSKNLPPRFDFRGCRNGCPKGRAGTACRKDCSEKSKKSGSDLKAGREACKANRTSCITSCKSKIAVLKTCRECPKRCKQAAQDEADKIYNASSVKVLPARWCKRLSPTKQCMDASIKMPINGGWGNCPEDMQVEIPNTGSGRLTIVQNLERWTKFRGLYKRIMVLPSDWSYLGAPDTKALFKRYGKDEADWKGMYKQAFNKIADLGWDGKLKTCVPVACTLASGTLSCPVPTNGIGNFENKQATTNFQKQRADAGLPAFVRPTSLDFDVTKCDPPLPPAATSCQIIGGYGVKAKVACSSYAGYCITAAASATKDTIAQDWKTTGGQEPTCNKPDSAMLETDAVPLLSQPSQKQVRRHRKLRGARIPDDGAMFLQGDVVFEDEEDFDEFFDEEEDQENDSIEMDQHVEL
mmetsp:Transcript_4112/g.6664  ORF Transcript_4112/g.6664 Transcript_4112/m.6664 type:complete len:974 (+) Transcript_4112:74-2995(+)